MFAQTPRGAARWLSRHNFDRVDRLEAALPRLAQALPATAVLEIEDLARQRYLFERVDSIEFAGRAAGLFRARR